MKRMLCAALAACSLAALAGEEYPELPRKITDETPRQKAERMAWWTHDRFGLFIHFGLYAVPARHEWVKSREYITDAVYDAKYLPRFNPDLFDAKEWARMAKAAGMRYAVLTTKHHEGFCMWDTKTTDYKITRTEFGRDLVREFVDAFRAEGLKVGFYFSIKDWHHPDYLVDMTHPLRPKDRKDYSDEAFAKLNEGRDWNRYRKYMWDQIDELLTNYGKVDIIWYDYTVKNKAHPNWGKSYKSWDAVNLVKHTRALQPGILIDNRLDLMDTDDGWDFVTPEQFKVSTWPTVRGQRVPWETCQTFSGSWGYYRDEMSWKSVPQLIELLVHSVSFGGNLIMNVGPTARGEFDYRAKERLEGFAKWMHWNSRAIYGCGEAPGDIQAPAGTLLTYNKKTKRLYVHLLDYPMGRLPVSFGNRIEYAQFLHDGSELFVKHLPEWQKHNCPEAKDDAFIELPVLKPNVEVPVIEIWLKERPPHVIAKIADVGKYEALNPHFKKAFEFLRRPDLATIPLGRYEIDGDNCWANVQEAKLKPLEGGKIEAHRKYIDIQAPISGPETIGLFTMDAEHLALPFKADRDCVLFPGLGEPVTLQPGECGIFFPPDGAHAPCRSADGPRTIRKVCIKVKAE